MKEIDVTVADVKPHAQVVDLSMNLNNGSATDNFDTTFDGMVYYK